MKPTHRGIAGSALAAVVALACNRYETRPVRPSECAPPPPPRDTLRVAAAPDAPGAVVGVVTDARTGAPVEGAQVVEFAARRGALTDAAGAFRLDSLTPGPAHDLVVRRIGYHQRDVDAVRVSAAAGARLRVPLAGIVMDGCPSSFMVRHVRKPWWKWW